MDAARAGVAASVRPRIAVDGPIASVAVVHAPVDHRDPAGTVALLHGFDRDGDVVQQAQSHAGIARCTVPTWPGRRIGDARSLRLPSARSSTRKRAAGSNCLKVTLQLL